MNNKKEIINLIKKECEECANHSGIDYANLIVNCDEKCKFLNAINNLKLNNKKLK